MLLQSLNQCGCLWKVNLFCTLTSTSAVQNQRNSSLLRLPAEIRNLIYTYTLGDYKMLVRHPAQPTIAFEGPARPITALLPLIYTCRQIHSKTARLVFKTSEWWIINPRSIYTLTRRGSHDPRINAIQCLYVNLQVLWGRQSAHYVAAHNVGLEAKRLWILERIVLVRGQSKRFSRQHSWFDGFVARAVWKVKKTLPIYGRFDVTVKCDSHEEVLV